MVKKISVLVIAGLLVAGFFVVCNSPSSSHSGTYNSAELKLLAGDVPGWTPGPYRYFSSPDEMFQIINGDVPGYTNVAVFSNAIMQMSQDTSFDGRVLSFPQEAGAVAVFNDRATRVWDSTAIGSYSTSTALGDTSVSDGIKVIAHFKNCYFEFTLLDTVYTNNRTLAISTAVQFVQAYENKTKN